MKHPHYDVIIAYANGAEVKVETQVVPKVEVNKVK